MSGDQGIEVEQLIGVYHANGSLRGEVTYVLGRLVGRAHCALCDITHKGFRRRAEFDDCVAALPVPFELVHLDERSPDVAEASEGRTPCILARNSDGGIVEILGPDELEACESDPQRLRAAIDESVAARRLRWGG